MEGKAVETERIGKDLRKMLRVSKSEVEGVLGEMGGVMERGMGEGKRVEMKGVGYLG